MAINRFNPRRDLFLFATLLPYYQPPQSTCFNPRRDLFLFATQAGSAARRRLSLFQSQAGFVPLCDLVFALREATHWSVSIPGGICSSLRQGSDERAADLERSFNPRRDLFLFATRCTSDRQIPGNGVSIPGGICSSLRRAYGTPVAGSMAEFQSQAGFVPLCDAMSLELPQVNVASFNPRRDLFLFATQIGPAEKPKMVGVSIPGGICSSLRRFSSSISPTGKHCFNPRRDLFLFATSHRLR